MGVSVIHLRLVVNERFPFLGKGSMHPMIQISIELGLYVALHALSRIFFKLHCFPYFRWYSIWPWSLAVLQLFLATFSLSLEKGSFLFESLLLLVS